MLLTVKNIAVVASIIASNLSYDQFASYYDGINDGFLPKVLSIERLRAQAAPFVSGIVLEVGVGTGIQLKFYDWSRINKYTGLL